MKYIDEYRNQAQVQDLAELIQREAHTSRQYRVMEFCGGHTHAIYRYGLQGLMPDNFEFIHGPGCPVCVLPASRLQQAMDMALEYDLILCTYGDMMRVPAAKDKSLMQARAEGADIRMVYSTQDVLTIAKDNPQRQVVFFAIGFETTAPATAVALIQAQQQGLNNLSFFCNHVLTPAALKGLLQGEQPVSVDGFLGPSHVSTIIGSDAYKPLAQAFAKPIVIAGFEPLDVMLSTLMCIRALNEQRYGVENEYARAVTAEGNRKAQQLMQRVFARRESFEWRGLGEIPDSALQIHPEWAAFDAEQRFPVTLEAPADHKACACADILRGMKKPIDCKLFGTACTPETPKGACMVSSEGACAAHWHYARYKGVA